MKFAPIVFLLEAGILYVNGASTPNERTSSCRSILVTTEKTTVTVDWVSTNTETVQAASTPSVPISKSTICTQQCAVLTLSTATNNTPSTIDWVPGPPPVTVSCLTIYDTTNGQSETTSSWVSAQPPTSISVTAEVLSFGSSRASSVASSAVSIVTLSFASSVYSTLASVPSLTGQIEETSGILSTSESCSTDLTVTKTIVETWWTSAPVTTILVTTRSVTITTVVVETYSTSTGGTVVPATRTKTTTIVSVDTSCSNEKGCCGGCMTAAIPERSLLTSTSTSPGHSIPEKNSQGTPDASVGETTISTAQITISTMLTTLGNASTSTAGGGAVTAGVGLGVLVGLMAMLG